MAESIKIKGLDFQNSHVIALTLESTVGLIDGDELAEREGFEPSIRHKRMPDFESGAFSLSATFPNRARCRIKVTNNLCSVSQYTCWLRNMYF